MRILLATVGLAGLLCVLPAGESGAERRAPRPIEKTLTLRAAQAGALAGLEVSEMSATAASNARQPVSDLVLRLVTTGEVAMTTVLGAEGSDQSGRGPAMLTADIILASGGRILIEEQAQCGPWMGNVALCRAGCDGGAVALVRQVTAEEASLRLVVGQLPADDGDGVRDGLRLGACRDGEQSEARLVPRRGLRRAEIELLAR